MQPGGAPTLSRAANPRDPGGGNRTLLVAVRTLAADGVGLAPDPLVDGDLLVACGFRPGKGFGDLLDAVYDAQLEGRVVTRDAGLRLADELAPAHGVARDEG